MPFSPYVVIPGEKMNPMDNYLIAFTDGSYKKIQAVGWKHSQWIHFTLPDGTIVRVNPQNVNYMHQGIPFDVKPDEPEKTPKE